MRLRDLKTGESGRITVVGGQGALRQHFLDMGVVPGAEIKLMKLAPMGDPMEFRIHGYELTLRLADAEKIEIEPVNIPEENAAEGEPAEKTKAKHPGLGEGGIYHVKADGNPLPMVQRLHLHLPEIKTAAKRPCLISLPGPISTWGISPELRLTEKTVSSKVIPKHWLRIFREFIPCRRTRVRKS